jgi:ribose 5-phosphate isomerase B
MKVFLGADHNGFGLKERIHAYLIEAGHEVVDVGDTRLHKDDDFPVYAAKVAGGVLAHEGSVGIVLCASGQGVCIAANRFKGIRACLAWNEESAFEARDDDDSNVLCLPAKQLDFAEAREIVDIWLNTPFSGAARYRRRNAQLDELV